MTSPNAQTVCHNIQIETPPRPHTERVTRPPSSGYCFREGCLESLGVVHGWTLVPSFPAPALRMSTHAFAPVRGVERFSSRRGGVCDGSRTLRAAPIPIRGNGSTSHLHEKNKFSRGGLSGVRRGAGSRAIVVPTTARLSGMGGPRVENESRADNQMVVAKTLLTVREGDLLSLTVTPGDGGGHLASGEDQTRTIWMTVSKISTSTGGRRQLEGESAGLIVQLIDQGRGLQGARLGVGGAVLDPQKASAWMDRLPGWKPLVSRRIDLEQNVLASVTHVSIQASLEKLTQCLENDPKPWTSGVVSPTRRAVIVDPVEAATQTAGELLALLRGKRTVVLLQLHASWLPHDTQPITDSPWAIQLLKQCLDDANVGHEISVSDDYDGHAGVSCVLYRTDKQFIDPKRINPALAAKTIAKLGAQGSSPAVTQYERVLVGMALGYSERDVAYHLRNEGGAFSATYFMRARKALGLELDSGRCLKTEASPLAKNASPTSNVSAKAPGAVPVTPASATAPVPPPGFVPPPPSADPPVAVSAKAVKRPNMATPSETVEMNMEETDSGERQPGALGNVAQ